jgi:predicted O-methyltransferase YrrM
VCLLILAASLACGQGRRGGRLAPEGSSSPLLPNSEAEKKILQTINEMVGAGETYANVPVADGRMLRLLAESLGAKHVVEVGTSTGISGLWFCMALGKTGGKLTTLEIDKSRAGIARKNFAKAGCDRINTIVEGDAHEAIAGIKGPVDVVFIDAEKEGYIDYLNKILPSVRSGGLILAHNVDMVQDYIRTVSTRADLDTTIFTGGGGQANNLKKR